MCPPLLALLLACRAAEVQNPCLDDPGLCPACSSDADCSLQGNPCLETVHCAHRDAGLMTIDIGCSEALEYSWPPDDECRCVESACQAEP